MGKLGGVVKGLSEKRKNRRKFMNIATVWQWGWGGGGYGEKMMMEET